MKEYNPFSIENEWHYKKELRIAIVQFQTALKQHPDFELWCALNRAIEYCTFALGLENGEDELV